MADPLVEAALAARARAYAPYSRFAVGAALRCADGSIHAGCNVENAAYPQGSCAEAGALSAMVLAGQRVVCEVVVAGAGSLPCTPCGGCRQRLREFAPAAGDLRVRVVDETGRTLLESTLEALLPHSFGPTTLASAGPSA